MNTDDCEKEGEAYDEDGLDAWSDADEGHAWAAGVSAMFDETDFMERVKRAAAPLKGPEAKLGDPDRTKYILWAAKKAAEDAAHAASDMTHITKAYEQKRPSPSQPR